MELLQHSWRKHGTKIIGIGVAAVGMLEYVDAVTIKIIETTAGPKWGPHISHTLLIVAGLATAWRGFQNSLRLKAALPAPPKGPP